MMSVIVGLGVILVLAILYMIFRIGNLVGLVKGKETTDPYNNLREDRWQESLSV